MYHNCKGVKIYVLADQYGYIYGFWVYYGKDSNNRTASPAPIVLDFASYLHGKGHIIITDSYYGSLSLADRLQEYGFKFVMCCRKNHPTFLFADYLQQKLEKKEWKHAVHPSSKYILYSTFII